MHYDFDEVHNRLGTYCTQWDYIEDRFNKKDLIPFSISDTDFIIPKPITKKIHEVADHQIYGYTRWNHHDFKSSITTYFKRRFDTDMEEDWILYSPSVMYSVSLLIRLLSQPHDKVLTMNPMYDAFINVIKENDRELISHHLIMEEGTFKIDFDVFEKQAQESALLLLCSPHNPTGRIWSDEEMHRMIQICKKYQVKIISDEIHMDIRIKDAKHHPLMKYYDEYKVRKYGFHGTSPSFVSKRAVEFLGLNPEDSKVIVCHLGNGSSISAVVNGKCVDTTMGLTPLEGVVMGTRSGNIDPAIMEFIAKKENLDISGMMNVLNKKSGLFGLSGGLSSDFRDLNEAAEGGNQDAANAIDVLAYGIAKFVGGYVAAMNGVDAIVFTAGIGENAIPVREKVVSYLGYLGVTLDKDANGHRGEDIVISTPDSKVKVAVIPTNEELAICRETVALV